ncbi:hypothetical protein [Magnetospira sp. QH-2]|uniref:hypothetical protein n=1 Tax=Magnetospira sp. (strain QH-2) TaxID=1288970 RepID=UPI0003E8154F|nr:hypothetical protein [Magnetospira sp. QH-2]CCQ75390.1 protein of unknown function [Magnetospira sp. QH-2]
MSTLFDLKRGSQDILEMMDILQVLIRADHVRHTATVQNMFIQMGDMVNQHFSMEESRLFRGLLIHEDTHVQATARRFLDGKRELKKFFKSYLHRWCEKGMTEDDCEDFIMETDRLFAMLRRWVADVESRIYPLVDEAA